MTMHHPKNDPSDWSRYFADEIEFGHSYGLLDRLGMALKVIYSLEAKKKVGQLLDEFPADVAHAHCLYHHLSPSVLVELKQRGVPTVMTAHDLKLACPAYKMLNRSGVCEKCRSGNLVHLVKNRCVRDSLAVSTLIAVESGVHKSLGLYRNNLDRVVVPSRFYLRKLIEWGWPENQLVYIPNYVVAKQYRVNTTPGNYFLFFGRLALEKGVETLLRAAAKSGVKLRVAGTGPEDATLRALAQDLGANVEFLGFVSGEPLWELVRGARAVVLPSEWYENAPMSVLESYASGKPVIGARIGGIPEMVLEDETGFQFESGNVEALADVLASVAGMTGERLAAMGARARAYVETTFTSDRYFSDTTALYASLGVKNAAGVRT